MSSHLSSRQNCAIYCMHWFISQPHDIIVIKEIRYPCAGTSIWLLMTAFPVSDDNFGFKTQKKWEGRRVYRFQDIKKPGH
jgi:hypothetical protein